jgi:hypothetical protein
MVESASAVPVVLVPADEIFVAPVGVSTAEMADGHVGEVECPAASGGEAMVVSDSLPSALVTTTEEATPSVTATVPA